MNLPTVIIGASPNPERYSYMATVRLMQHGHEVYPIGIRGGRIEDRGIMMDRPQLENIHTVTLYVGPAHQGPWIDYVIGLHPKRIIFNPGTENSAFYNLASEAGIECLEACTLVMLSTNQY